MAEWFYGKDGAQSGPISELEIRNLISSGTITPDTLIWREGMGDWQPMTQVPEFSGNTESDQSGYPSSENYTPYSSPQTNPAAGAPAAPLSIPTDGLSIASMVLGILAIVSCYVWALFGIPAVICGHMSLKKIKHSKVPIQGKGMAIAGLVTGYIGIAIQIAIILLFVVAFSNASINSGY